LDIKAPNNNITKYFERARKLEGLFTGDLILFSSLRHHIFMKRK